MAYIKLKLRYLCLYIFSFINLIFPKIVTGDTVYIQNLDNFNFGTITPTETGFNENMTNTACVYRDRAGKTNYKVTADGLHDVGSSFYLERSGGTDTIIYTVEWSPTSSGTNFDTLLPGVASSTYTNASNTSGCTDVGGTNAQLRITVSSAAIPPAGTYQDTLTLTMDKA